MAGELGYDTGPFVSVATFCDRVMEEKDGAVSLMRLIDTLSIEVESPEAPDSLPPGVISSTLVIQLRAGQSRGSQTIQVVLEGPHGRRTDGPELAVNFPGGPGSGSRVIMPVQIQIDTAGLYWADVYVNKRLMTRVPLEVKYGFTRGPKQG